MKQFVFFIALLLLVGCATNGEGNHVPLEPMENPDLSLLIVADNQIMDDYGAAIKENSRSANISGSNSVSTGKFRGSARRWTKLNMFGPDMLKWIIQKEASGEGGKVKPAAVLHLGDALQLSCRGEFNRFVAAIGGNDVPWYMAPGNHDGYYSGITFPKRNETNKKKFSPGIFNLLDDYYAGWGGVCTSSRDDEKGNDDENRSENFALQNAQEEKWTNKVGDSLDASQLPKWASNDDEIQARKKMLENNILPKHKLVLALVDEVGKNEQNFTRTKPECGTQIVSNNERSPLKRLFYDTSIAKPWTSFLLQELYVQTEGSDITVSVFMVDTGVFKKRPKRFWSGASKHGRLGDCQIEKLTAWLDSSNATIKIVVGHQPFKNIKRKERKKLENIFQKYSVKYYLSAHTHDGYDAIHTLKGLEKNAAPYSFTEHNISSLIDTPLEYGVLNLKRSNGGHVNTMFDRKILTYDRYKEDDKKQDNDLTKEGRNRRKYSSVTFNANNMDCKKAYTEIFSKKNTGKSLDPLDGIAINFPVDSKFSAKELKSGGAKSNAYLDQLKIYETLLNYAGVNIPNDKTIVFRDFDPPTGEANRKYYLCKAITQRETSSTCLQIKTDDDAKQHIGRARALLNGVPKKPIPPGASEIISTSRLLSALSLYEAERSKVITDPDYTHLKACLAVSPW